MKKLLVAAMFAASTFTAIGGVATAEECYTTIGEAPHAPGPGCPVFADCSFNTVSQETATGGQDTFTGVAEGAVVGQAGDTVSIRCYVTVDGNDQASTPTGGPTPQFAQTEGQITYTATDTQNVELCTEWTVNGNPGGHCDPTTRTQIPPQPVIDLLDQIFEIIEDASGIPDFIICPILASLAPGIPGVIDITPEGDVYILGIFIWDCPPYEEDPPA